MADRITQAMLDSAVYRINDLLGTPHNPYTQYWSLPGATGVRVSRLTANPGCYHLSGAYGGHNLCRMSDGGGTFDVFTCGHVPRRKLWELMQAFIAGIKVGEAKE